MLRSTCPLPAARFLAALLLLLPAGFASAQSADILPGTQPLTWDGDLSARMVEGIDKFLMRETDRSIAARQKLWRRDFSSRDAYAKSVQSNREHLQKYIGAVEVRQRVRTLEYLNDTATLPLIAETEAYRV